MDINLILGDCAEKLKEIPNKSIDLVVTSPPYDNLRQYKGYTFDFETIAKELYRVIKEGGVVVWIVGDATVNGSETGTSFTQALYFKELGFNLHDTMIWQKSKMPHNHNRYEQFFEYMFIFSKGKPKTFNGIRDRRNVEAGKTARCQYRDTDGVVKKTSSFRKTKIAELGLRYNIWAVTPCVSSTERVGHPAPFSLQIAKDHIISWSDEGDTILDPMMGSGTTGVAASILNRKFTGIEISDEFFDLAKQRIENPEDVLPVKSTQSLLEYEEW